MKAILTAGGTAGHVNPALAIAREIAADGGDVLFIGNEGGMEVGLVEKDGFPMKTIRVSGFERSLSLKNFKTVWQAIKGIFDTAKIIKEYNPDIVIGCGGYVSGSAVFAAATKKIPTLIHEQNAFPGLANKILAKMVNRVCISFEESRKYFKNADNIVFTGNPIRQSIMKATYEGAREALGVTGPMILVMGGSRGAPAINNAMIEAIPYIDKNTTVVWGTGKGRYDEVMAELANTDVPENIKIMPYIFNMDEILAASDIVVGRSGAISVSEICVKGKPCVLIPSPYVTGNHQMINALALKEAGAAEIIEQKDLDGKKLAELLAEMLADKARLKAMQENGLRIATPEATKDIYEEVKKIVRTH